MALRLPGSKPSATTAGSDLVGSLGNLAAAVGRWLALQPVAQGLPVYAERARQASAETAENASEWAGATASRARTATADAASTTKTAVVNLVLVAALLWWVDRLLTGKRDTA